MENQATRLQNLDPLYFRLGAILTFLFILIIFWSIPEPRPRPYTPKKIEKVNLEQVEATQAIEEPTQPQKVQKPKTVVEAAEGEMVEEDETIADTSLNLDEDDENHIVPSKIQLNRVTSSSLNDFLSLENTPIFYDEGLTWNDEFTQFTDRV